MIQSFTKLKKRAVLRSVGYSILLGGSCGLFAFGGIWVLFKRLPVAFPWWGYLALALGVTLLVGGIALLATYPTTKRFARRLDRDYGLGERAQTMVEFSGKNGEIVDLQRENTEAVLSTLPKKKPTVGKVFQCVLPVVLSVAMATTAFFVPARKIITYEPIPEEDLPIDLTVWEISDLQEIIDNVRSDKDFTVKLQPLYLESLQSILNLVQKDPAPTKGEVLSAVGLSMTLMFDITNKANTYNALSQGMKGKAQLTSLSDTFKESATVYTTLGINKFDYDTIKGQKSTLNVKVVERVGKYANILNNELSGKEKADYESYVADYVEALNLAKTSDVWKGVVDEDALKQGILTLGQALQDSSDRMNNDYHLSLDGAKNHVTKSLETFTAEEGAVTRELTEQAYSYLMRDYVLHGLSRIFKVAVPVDPVDVEDSSNEEDPGNQTEGDDGELAWGNDSLVLDPTDGKQKPYTEILSTYYKPIMDMLQPSEEGEEETVSLPEDIQQYLKDYFQSLSK